MLKDEPMRNIFNRVYLLLALSVLAFIIMFINIWMATYIALCMAAFYFRISDSLTRSEREAKEKASSFLMRLFRLDGDIPEDGGSQDGKDSNPEGKGGFFWPF